jgi:hypothetical protein
MSVKYVPVQWNNNKWFYDAVLVICMALYLGIFSLAGPRLLSHAQPSWIEDSVQGKGFMLKYGPDFADRRAFTMLIHYFSSRREGINELLHQSVQSGHLPPSQFASFNDFMAEWGKRKYSNQFYNVWHSDPNKDHIEDINERRADIGLGSYQFQIQVFIRKRELQRRQALNSVVIFW